MKPKIKNLINFQKLLLKLQAIERIVCVPPTHRLENDVEHSYHLAMMAWYLSPWFPELDVNKLIQYALIHDIIEIYAGDTYCFDEEASLSKYKREKESLDKLLVEWPDFAALEVLVDYEKQQDKESIFIKSLDKIMPIIVIHLDDGYAWHKYNVTAEQLYKNKLQKIKDPDILKYFIQLYEIVKKQMPY